jgi:esterase/lipase superfamily enzyme
MALFKNRKIVIGSTILAAILIVAGVWFYNLYFASTASTLRFAEDFGFRRMTVAQLGDQGTYRFFFISNRQVGNEDAPVMDRFRNEREDQLKFGFFDTHIEPTVGLGMLINPTEWFQNEEMRIDAIQTVEQQSFIVQLRTLVEKSPHRGLLVIVHGFREAFPSALRKTAFLGHILDIDSPVLVFDWPGNQGSSLRGYRRARSVAEESGAELARTLKLIINEVEPERLWLVANSMGGQVVVDAFSLLYADDSLADAQTEIEDVVLTAPDVDHEEFNQQFKKEIASLTTNLTVYVSANDRALLMSRIINRGRRIGESTLDTMNPEQFEEAARVFELVDADSELVTLVDVTPINRTRNFHNFSLETPEFFDDLFLRITNEETPSSRGQYQVKTPDGRVYWVLTRGR